MEGERLLNDLLAIWRGQCDVFRVARFLSFSVEADTSLSLYQQLAQEKEVHRKSDPLLLSSLGDTIDYLTPEMASIFANTQELRQAREDTWNLTAFTDNTGYIAILTLGVYPIFVSNFCTCLGFLA